MAGNLGIRRLLSQALDRRRWPRVPANTTPDPFGGRRPSDAAPRTSFPRPSRSGAPAFRKGLRSATASAPFSNAILQWPPRTGYHAEPLLPRLWHVPPDRLPLESRQGRRSEEHTSELQSLRHLVCRLLL